MTHNRAGQYQSWENLKDLRLHPENKGALLKKSDLCSNPALSLLTFLTFRNIVPHSPPYKSAVTVGRSAISLWLGTSRVPRM
jgi:hypothetical protein